VSGTGHAHGISPYRAFRSNWVVQCMRVWSLPALLFPLRARLSVSRSAARQMRASRGSDPSPPAQAPESPYLPRFEAELGEMRENGPDTLRPVWQRAPF
jgi:hypothetical protein